MLDVFSFDENNDTISETYNNYAFYGRHMVENSAAGKLRCRIGYGSQRIQAMHPVSYSNLHHLLDFEVLTFRVLLSVRRAIILDSVPSRIRSHGVRMKIHSNNFSSCVTTLPKNSTLSTP